MARARPERLIARIAMDGLIPTQGARSPAPGTFSALPSFRVHLLAGMSARHAELRFLKHFGLRLLEARILGLVGTFGALSLKHICTESDIEKSHASRLIGRLMERGLVEKLDDASDQRAISVRLTAEGVSMHRAVYADSVARNERWLAVLNEDERRQLLSSVEKLIQHTRSLVNSDPADLPPVAPAEAAAVPQVMLDERLARLLHGALGLALASKENR